MEETEPHSQTVQEEVDLTPKMKETMAEMIATMMETMQENLCKKLDDYIAGSEATHDVDGASIEATNDWDTSRPPHDLQTSPDVVDQYLAETQPSQLSWEQISQEFSVAEKTGPAIDEKLVQLVSSLIPEKLSKTKLDELVEKYPRPDNCPLLVAPKCNKVVWHQLKLPTKTTDTALQKCQKLLVAAMCSLLQATTKAPVEVEVEDLIDPLSGPCSFCQLGI